MKASKIEGTSKTHPITLKVMSASAKKLSQYADVQQFIDFYGKIPEDVDAQEYKRSFIDQVNQSTKAANSATDDDLDDLDDLFDNALETFYNHLHADFFNLSQDLKDINLPAINMKGLYHGFLNVLEHGLNTEQMNTIYLEVDQETRDKFFTKQKNKVVFKKSKSPAQLIRHLRNNTEIKIKLTSDQVKNILDSMEIGDLINLDTLTSTTKSKATDFWTSMLVTTYRWSGTVVEIAALARYLPFLATLNNYLVAPIVTVIGFIVALFNYKKHHVKEANLNLKFLKRCLSKNQLKIALDKIQSEVDDVQSFELIEQLIQDSDYKDDFKSTLDELDDVDSPLEKLERLKTALIKQRDLFNDEEPLGMLVEKISPQDEDECNDESVLIAQKPSKSYKIFGHELPDFLQTVLNSCEDFCLPFLQFIKIFTEPLITWLKKNTGPYVMPVIFGIITAVGIITLTLFYTLAPEILIPITVLAVALGAGTGVLRFLRDRQREMSHSIMQGSKIEKCELKDQINDLNEHKKISQALNEVQRDSQQINQSEKQEMGTVEITVKGENNLTETFHVTKAMLSGLQRHTITNRFTKNASEPVVATAPELEESLESTLGQ